MNFAALLFYFLALLLIGAAIGVVTAKNPVHAVLFLIKSFSLSVGLFLLVGAEFIAMSTLIVYVGAVAILFLFVVMMLDINQLKLREGFVNYLAGGLFIAGTLAVNLFILLVLPNESKLLPKIVQNPEMLASKVPNSVAIGQILYTEYFLEFQLAGLILLLAMVGAISLTLAPKTRKKVPKAANKNGVELIQIQTGSGIEI